MGFNIKDESTLALTVESTEGTFVAPSAGSDYVRVKSEGANATLERNVIERNVLTSTIEEEASRIGTKTATLEYDIEVLGNSTVGAAPQDLDVSLRSVLGGRRQNAAADTSGSTHTSTVINFADTSSFQVGDIVVVKESGAYEARPISAVTTNTSITLAFPLDNGAPSNSVVVEKFTTYYSDAANAITMSAEWNEGGNINNNLRGLRVASMQLTGWEVGGVPSLKFSATGLDQDKAVSAPAQTPSFDTTLPPVVLSACAWLKVNGTFTKVSYRTLGLSVENTISPIEDACDADGKIASRITKQVVTAEIDPYQASDAVTRFSDFNDNDDVGLFAYAYNPSSTAGQFDNTFAVWIPQAKIQSFVAEDADGVLVDKIGIKSYRSSGNDTLFLGFI